MHQTLMFLHHLKHIAMRRLIIIILTLSMSLSLAAQANNQIAAKEFKGMPIASINSLTREGQEELLKNFAPRIVPEYFILGTLNDKTWGPDNKLKDGEVDYYQTNEESLVKFLETYVHDSLGILLTIKKDEDHHRIRVYSDQLTKQINGFFSYSDGNAYLNPDLFKTDKEFLSYLLGAYFRHGQKISSNNFKVQTFNIDPDRMFSLLRKSGCDLVTFKHFNSIPGAVYFTFESSVLIEKYFRKMEIDKERVRKDSRDKNN